MEEGYFYTHLRRMRFVYKKRQDFLISFLQKHASDILIVEKQNSGMHLIAWLHPKINDQELAAYLEKLKIMVKLNMLGYRDTNFELDCTKGCAGTAFQSEYKNQILVDLVDQGMAYGKSITEPVQLMGEQELASLGHKKYGVAGNSVWEGMRSLISVPIYDKDQIPIGVLTIDCDKRLKDSRLDSEALKYNLSLVTDAIGGMIGG